MTDHHLANDRFLALLEERQRRRARKLSSSLSEPLHTSFHSVPQTTVVPLRKPRSPPQYPEATSNLSTHYLFSSSRPQNEIQTPFPNCFEGYPKLQRYIHT